MTELLADFRHALRLWRRHAGFAAVAVALVTVGIAANVGIFSVLRAVVLRPLPYPDAGRLVSLIGIREGAPTPSGVLSAPDVADYAAGAPSLVAGGGVAITTLNLTGAGDPQVVDAGRVTAGWFATLGVTPALGRLPDESDFSPGTGVVAALGDAFWRRAFGADPGVLGRVIRLNELPVTVVGVLPPDPLQYPSNAIALWIPLRSDASRGSRNLAAVGRLAPGATPATASRDLAVVAGRLAASYPESNQDRGAIARPLMDAVAGPVRPALLLALAATAAVLLIACANLGNMLLARAAGRGREFAVRTALGAGRRRLAAQLCAEGAVLALPGALLGLLLAGWAADAFVALSPGALPRSGTIGLDPVVLGFTVAITGFTALVSGLVPALRVAGRRGGAALHSGARAGQTAGVGRVGDALVVLQVALSCALMVGATLLLQSFLRLRQVPTGFETADRYTFQVDLPARRYRSDTARVAFYQELERGLAALPGVTSVGAVSTLPLSGGNLCDTATEGDRALPDCIEFRTASPGYFAAMGVPLLHGRALDPTDTPDRSRVAVVNETFARRGWPGEDPVGHRVTLVGETFEIVGVVGDVRHFGPANDVPPELYAPVAQTPLPWLAYVVHTAGPAAPLARPVSAAVWRLDPELPLRNATTLDQLLGDAERAQRVRASLMGGLAAAALVLALLGLYGLLSYVVAARTRDYGVRLALGASAAQVMREVLARALSLTGVGVLAGAALAYALSGALRRFLFATGAHDPVAYAAVAAAFVLAAAAAATLPARRATRIDPMEALRHE